MDDKIKIAAAEFKQQFSEDPDLMPIADTSFQMGCYWMMREYQVLFAKFEAELGRVTTEKVAKEIIAGCLDNINKTQSN